jgi:hypothetical protein
VLLCAPLAGGRSKFSEMIEPPRSHGHPADALRTNFSFAHIAFTLKRLCSRRR